MEIKEKMVRLSVEVPTSVKSQLNALAIEQERSVHFLMKRAINAYLHNAAQEKAKQAAFYEAAESAIEHYEKTGLHVSHQEVTDWLKSQKSDSISAPCPPCHK